MKEDCEKLIMLATTIGLELVKGKNKKEIDQIKFIIFQIYSTICSISNLADKKC